MTGLEAIEIIRDRLIEYKNKAEGTNIKCLISPQFAQVRTELKALEIIKEKRVNVGTFIHLTKILKKDYEQCKALNNTFGANICDTEKEFLTEEEYETIKEVLE